MEEEETEEEPQEWEGEALETGYPLEDMEAWEASSMEDTPLGLSLAIL